MKHKLVQYWLMIVVILVLIAVGHKAHGAEPESIVTDTRRVIIFDIEGQVVGLLFISKTGDTIPMHENDCTEHTWCRELLQKLGEEKNVLRMHFEPVPSQDSQS